MVEKNQAEVEAQEVPLIIRVQDSGVGIPPDQFDMIFEPFSRLTPTYQGRYFGVGLGLYLVKQYVTEMGGKITVESEVGKGSAFHLALSLQEAS